MDYQPNDLNSVKILICYLLHHLEEKTESEELYEIAVDSGIINYFYYNEAIDELLVNDTIYSDVDENGNIMPSMGIEVDKNGPTKQILNKYNITKDKGTDLCTLQFSTKHENSAMQVSLLTMRRTVKAADSYAIFPTTVNLLWR